MTKERDELNRYRIFSYDLEPIVRDALVKEIDERLFIDLLYDLEKISEAIADPPPLILIFGPAPAGTSLAETAQVARIQYPNRSVYHITTLRKGFDRADLIKNGFTDAYLFPADIPTSIQTLKDELSRASEGKIRSFRPIQLVDLVPGETLDFDTYLYLPANRKHVKWTSAGDSIDSDRFEKLTRSGINAVHIATEQIQAFYAFVAKKLRSLQKGEGLSETERQARMASAIRNLMASIFNDSSSEATIDRGRSILADCQQIVKNFILQGSDPGSWYTKMLQITGAESGSYHHSGNVATFGALFSLAISAGKPEDIALAGLLHDLGLTDLPPEIQGKKESERTPEEEKIYRKHVEFTLKMIRFRKMILPDTVMKAIAQHHEKWSGTGYPRRLAGSRISLGAQIVSIADRFDELTLNEEGRPRMKPSEAFKILYEESLNHPAEAVFDLELLKKLIAVFSDVSET